MSDPIVQIDHLSHHYGVRAALTDVSLAVTAGEIFGFLGPNGSGKTTLFRVLSTLIPPQGGFVRMLGLDIAMQRDLVRKQIGVVFQSPSLDIKLTAIENLRHHGHLYGLRGAELTRRIDHALEQLGLRDRASEYVETFSGGMRRRVELAKGMMNDPQILLLDEPSTGLDPGARIDLWNYLKDLQSRGVTILLTTHLMDEADRCSRLAIMNRGVVAACDTPNTLKSRIGGDVITLTTSAPAELRQALHERLAVDSLEVEQGIRFERSNGHQFIPQLIESLPGMVDAVSVGKPTLEDVFLHVTGRDFRDE
ncbi:MAG TPA: ATP-binding cassette domain-containing protein [Tepidisphaeraceae bacterium]|jgi:ABC-2 type transport system ATP-binding protein|nr:ATP-binding cassette domain-containing protein [Tepidisphaeraceae bacterium]